MYCSVRTQVAQLSTVCTSDYLDLGHSAQQSSTASAAHGGACCKLECSLLAVTDTQPLSWMIIVFSEGVLPLKSGGCASKSGHSRISTLAKALKPLLAPMDHLQEWAPLQLQMGQAGQSGQLVREFLQVAAVGSCETGQLLKLTKSARQ